jgi:pilus assembly protein CpaB
MRRQALFLVFAASAAALAAMMVNSALKGREAEIARAQAQSVQIAVAAHDLPLGSRIDEGSLKLTRWSRDALPPGAFFDTQAVKNNFVRRALVTNEPITAEALFNGDKSAGVMPLVIPLGMRAMSVQVDEVSDIAGFVLPHARVDVLAALSSSDVGQKPVSKIVLENVEVLAVAQEMEKEKDQPELVKVVTLIVKPDEAELLALASREGVLRLAMRNYNDSNLVQTAGADLNRLLSAYNSAPSARHKGRTGLDQPPITVEVMRDGKTMRPAAFVNHASVPQAGQWAALDDDLPAARVQSPKPSFDQQDHQIAGANPGASTKPQNSQNSQPAASSNAQGGETSAAPGRKTIEVDP